MKREDFVHLHVHSDHSTLDGCARIEEYVKAAAERGAPAVALTDHGTMRGAYELAKQCDKYGVKPIFGIEAYVCDDMHLKGTGKRSKKEKEEDKQSNLFKTDLSSPEGKASSRKTTHLTLWALDNDGLKNLYRLSSKAWIEGYYYRPRIDLDTLIEHNKGVAVGSGCAGSVLNDAILRDDKRQEDIVLSKLVDTFGDRFYLEFMPHILEHGVQSRCNEKIAEYADLLRGKSVSIATQDAHYLEVDAAEHHNILLAMQTQDVLSNKERFAFSEEPFDFKTRDDMARMFLQNHKGLGEDYINDLLDGTLHLAERCTARIDIDPLKGLLPKIEVPEIHDGNEFAYLKDLAFRGFEWRDIAGRAKVYAKRYRVKFDYALELYTERLVHELSVFKKAGFSPYFLILYDMYQMMLERGIAVGPGRGSAAGSLISYLIGITQVDPIEHRLMFERFIAPGRINWPDVDCFPAGTMIWTERGLEPIETISVGTRVVTRRGLKRVTHTHQRRTRPGEGLIEIVIKARGKTRRLTSTPNHPIFCNLNGKIEATKAKAQYPGSRVLYMQDLWEALSNKELSSTITVRAVSIDEGLCCLRKDFCCRAKKAKTKMLLSFLRVKVGCQENQSSLSELREDIREEIQQPQGVFSKMREASPPLFGKTELSDLRKWVSRTFPSEDVFSELRQAQEWERYFLARTGGISKGSGTFCAIIFGSRLREVASVAETDISVRGCDGEDERRDDLYSRFCGRKTAYRTEGLERPGCEKTTKSKALFGKAFARFVLQRGVRRVKAISRFWESASRTVRDAEREVRCLQNQDKGLSDLREGVQVAIDKKPQNVQSGLQQSTEANRKGKGGQGCTVRNEMSYVWQDVLALSPTEQTGVLLGEVLYRCEEAEIVHVRKIDVDCEVYDLTIEDEHEYFADGVLVHNCDIQEDRVSEVIEYLRQKYGREYVAQISTFGTMSGRQVVKDVARTYEISYQEANIATAGIPDKEVDPLKWALEHSKPMKAFALQYPSVIRHSTFLQGLTKSVGMHAAGVVVSPVPLTDLVPLEVRRPSGEECVVTAFDMHGVEDIGLLKIDLLKLKTCTVLANAAAKIKERTGEEFDYLELSLEDKQTLDRFTQRDFVGIFQFDSQAAYSASEGMNFDCFDDIVAINAINRPGAIDFCDEFKTRKKDPKQKKMVMFHESVSAITQDALGLMIYQEHVIKIATDVAGYTPSEADKLRKKIGKSMGHAAIEEERPKFVGGCDKTTPSMSREVAEKLFDAIVKFGRYAFNRSHAVCYSMLAYWTMYLKVYYPLEFYYALMSSEKKLDRIHSFVKDAERHGVITLLPDINLSGNGFVIERDMNAIVCSLTDIKKVGEKAVEAVVEERNKNGKFKSFTNFLDRCRGRAVHKGNIESLALAGAFDKMVPNPRWLVTELPRMWKEIDKKRWDFIERAIDASKSSHQWSEDTRAQYAEEVNPFVARTHISILYSNFIMERVRPKFTELRETEMAEKKILWSAARIQDYQVRTVGDSVDVNEFPSPKIQEKIGWGKEWWRLTVEGVDGKPIWIKVDYQLVPVFKPIIESGSSPGIIFCAEVNPRYGSLILHFMADLDRLVEKVENNESLELYERLFVDHPSVKFPWKSKEDRVVAMLDLDEVIKRDRREIRVIGIVDRVHERPDKNGNIMAFFGLVGVRGYIRVLCFSRSWEKYGEKIKRSYLMGMTLSRLDRDDLTWSLDSKIGNLKLHGRPKNDGRN